MADIVGMTFVIVGLAFDIFGCIGLVRLPDVYNRLQASTKCVTIGTCGIMLGTMLIKGAFSSTGFKSFLVIVFLLLTTPVAAHAIARGAHRAGVKLWKESVCDKYLEDKEGLG